MKYLIIILFISLILLTSGCLNSKKFENNEIAFDYPANWENFSNLYYDPVLDAVEVTEVVDPKSQDAQLKYTRFVRIERKEIASGQTLKQIFNNTYSSKSSSISVSERNTTVDGVMAYEKIYKRPHGEPWYQIRDVWLEKNGKIYIISCWVLPDNFENAQKDFDIITSSFHVK